MIVHLPGPADPDTPLSEVPEPPSPTRAAPTYSPAFLTLAWGGAVLFVLGGIIWLVAANVGPDYFTGAPNAAALVWASIGGLAVQGGFLALVAALAVSALRWRR